MKSKEQSGQAPLGAFEEQIMLAVLRLGNDPHAMTIRREIENVTGRSITIGSVYVTLDRLESKELVASSRVSAHPSGSRRVFAITAAGARALAETRTMRERLWRGVELRTLLRTLSRARSLLY